MKIQEGLQSLYSYWVNCNDIFILVPHEYNDAKAQMSKELKDFANKYQSFHRLTTAYGLLYVVIEGYQELKLVDDEIDKLLACSEHVEKLRRLRNFIFHFHKNPFSPKLLDFIDLENSIEWIRTLRRSFESFFIRSLPIRELIEAMRKSVEEDDDEK